MTARCGLLLPYALLGVVATPAWADSPVIPAEGLSSSPMNQPMNQSANQPSSQPASTAPYQDRILSSETLSVFADSTAAYNAEGLPRSLNLEWLGYYNRQDGKSRLDQGMALQQFWQGMRYGEFSLDAVGLYNGRPDNLNDQRWQGRLTLWQRNFHLNNHWRSNNGLGVLSSPLPSLLRSPSRIFLPATSLLGLSTDVQDSSGHQHLQLAAGQAGDLNGRQVAGFETSPGQVYALNAEQRFANGWQAALALLQNDGSPASRWTNTSQPAGTNSRSALLALGWQQPAQSMQFNVLSSQSAHDQTIGGWLDGHYRTGSTEHQYGWYYLQPELNWGGQLMQQNAHGSYYRFSHDAARWLWSGGLDYIQSVEGQQFDGLYANSFLRYQANPRLSYGGGTTIRHADSDRAFGQQLFVEKQHAFGQSKAQLDYNHIPGQQFDSIKLDIDHAFNMAQDQRLSVAASYEQLQWQGRHSHVLGLSSYGGVNLTDTLSLDGSARWSRNLQQKQQSVGLNLTARWQMHPDWQLSGTLYQDQSRIEPDIVFDPLQPDLKARTQTQNQLSVLFSLRYQKRAGTPALVMAGPAGAATGSIRGSIFLDENRDGTRAASESGAAQVTVVLNERYSVRTNERGEFEFPLVATGLQTLRVVSDELPLPWYFEAGSLQRGIQVNVRETSVVDIGAIRMR